MAVIICHAEYVIESVVAHAAQAAVRERERASGELEGGRDRYEKYLFFLLLCAVGKCLERGERVRGTCVRINCLCML